ncbi:MAG: zinc-ribbon domain-containing protein [Agathobacter sp.]|nr:zinc-ribbon domain-containing protein [Lachnospiraceae bacterium]MBQ6812126.1 zinc-ribbon domain-containing protein [Agathobacter sp.]
MVNKIKVSEVDDLMSLLDNDRNTSENIDISKFNVNSSKEINWKCKNGHTFKEKINVMYRRKYKCFYCTGRQIWSGENDLQTLYPELAKEFNIDKNGITPDKISPKDTKSYWWTCNKNHPSFWQSVEHRVSRKTKCPYCTGKKVIFGESDLETLFPEIAKEWDIEKNDGILPRAVSAYTYNSYWWICPKGHSYKKKVVQRTKFHKPIDCPKCIKAHSTSFPEQAIYYYVKKCFPEAINRYKEPFEKGMELDIYIPTFKFGIEYDGLAFHNDKDQHQRELKKYSECKKLGIKLIRIKESQNTWNDTADKIFYVSKKMKDDEFSSFLRHFFSNVFWFKSRTFTNGDTIESLLNHRYGFPTDFNVSRDRTEILEYLVDIEHSFGSQYPELATMWDEKGNGELTPFMFTSGSNYQASWKCPKCGDTWKSPISSIVSRKVSSCRVCSMRKNGNTITKVKASKYGSLAERSELLLKQWDFEANESLSPYEIPLNYSFKVAWKCNKCGYKWSSSPNTRVRRDKIADCPHCSGRVAMQGVDDLETLYPDIAKTWDYEKNRDTLPSQIKPYSNKKYYWICDTCGNSYATYPGNKIKGSGCPDCARIKIGEKNSKLVGQFNDAGELIKTYQGLHQAAREIQVVPNAIFQAVKNGRKSKGYYWKYVTDEKD